MSQYRVQYAPEADSALKAMDSGLRNSFDQGMRKLTADPYGHGSRAVGGERDRRQAVVGGAAIAVYYVSSDPSVLLVTVVRVVY
ncbi:type II toxin-antitoxin system RelE family toxin [Streptomyces sp. URMC 127]|uniref:type II toxin-antitoxin system RelE family toxin n=1 Tax=Streptomyces sp. URMC 127 TaxID=3423402 RepID=UPI003F1CB2BF